MQRRMPIEERFWKKVEISGPDDVWPWRGSLHGSGYGRFWVDGTIVLAHRVAYELTYGPIPEGMVVCHTSDVPADCNPRHLFIGTQVDNVKDCKSKGRNARGETHARAKITESDVIEIRESPLSNDELSKLFNLKNGTICNIRVGRTWKHVGGKRSYHPNPQGRLTDDEVRKIRRDTEHTQRQLAQIHGTTPGMVWCIRHGKAYKHVPNEEVEVA